MCDVDWKQKICIGKPVLMGMNKKGNVCINVTWRFLRVTIVGVKKQ
jgi:hypothetical protein